MTIHVRTIVLLQCNHCKVHFYYAHSGSNSVPENREQRICPNSVCLYAPARSKFGIFAHKRIKNVLPFPTVVFSGFLVIFTKKKFCGGSRNCCNAMPVVLCMAEPVVYFGYHSY
jgi:hypothetical protein